MTRPWPRKAPRKFLSRNDGQIRELLPLRCIGPVEACNRCFTLQSIVNELDVKLTIFVCKSCRNDDQTWDYQKRENGISITLGAMVNESPRKEDTDHQSGEGRS